MKSIILFCSILCSTISFAQMSDVYKTEKVTVIGDVKSGPYTIGKLSYKIVDDDTLCTLMFYNRKYSQITDYQYIQFSAADGTIDQLYNAFKSFFTPENIKNKDYKLNFDLGETPVLLANLRQMGITTVYLGVTGGNTNFTEKQVDKIFGKN